MTGKIRFLLLLLMPINAFADSAVGLFLPNTTVSNGCVPENFGGSGGKLRAVPVYEPIKYTCNAGQYLPADAVECTECIVGSYCDGGTYEFSETTPQGITECPDGTTSEHGATTLTDCTADVQCLGGYYLPANGDTCAICPENHYCVGGTFTPSNQDAGLAACPDSMISPTGAAGINECGLILHVNDSIIYLTTEQQTTPALAVRYGNNTYYAKMTPVSQGVQPMNADTVHSMRAIVDGVEYFIHDNTIKENNDEN